MKNLKNLLAVVLLCAMALTSFQVEAKGGKPSIQPADLTCEYQATPLLDIQNPRFAWINANPASRKGAAQTAYRIRVADSADGFDNPVWDSGKVESDDSAFITYQGPALKSRTSYWWQVQVWDEQGNASEWSAPAMWHMGLLSQDEWQGKWIGAPWQGEQSYDSRGTLEFDAAPLLRKEFKVKAGLKSARYYGTGVGYHEIYLNGERIGEDYLSPNQTNYSSRPELKDKGIVVTDPFAEYTIMYLSHDFTSMLNEGDNAFGVILGDGFYNTTRNWVQGYGTTRFIGQIELEYEDGTTEIIVSDESWTAEKSAITSNQIYYGECYDARLEHEGWSTADYDDSAWVKAAVKRTPIGKLIPQNGPADRITQRYAPISIDKQENGTIKVKFPEEISGWVALKNIVAEEGQKISIKYLSESPGNGDNIYIAKGSGDESYHARFTWFVFSEVEISGKFETSNDLINTINKIWQRSQLDNMHGAIASDCPHRERSAYTGDGQIACVTVMHNFDAAAFYNKWIRDIRGSQSISGYVPNGAPWQPGCGGGVAWGAAMEIMPWEFYTHYGDERMLEQNFEAMCKHVRWMTTWVDDETGIMHSHDVCQWKNLGDWCPPREFPRGELVHTFYLWKCADIASTVAKRLGHEAEAKEFAALRDKTASAFHKAFYDPATGSYGKHGSNVYALKMGVPAEYRDKVIAALKSNIAEVNDHLDTGIGGTRYLFEVLCDNGLKDLAYKIINQRDFPSFGWWIEQGATTTWEQWDGGNSRNHPMFGGGIGWFYRDLAGLRCGEAGFRTFDVKPVIPEGLEWVNYSHNTTYGTIDISWQCRKGRFTLECDVPVGATATIWVPCGADAPKVKESDYVKSVGKRDGYALYEVKSGSYKFSSKL